MRYPVMSQEYYEMLYLRFHCSYSHMQPLSQCFPCDSLSIPIPQTLDYDNESKAGALTSVRNAFNL